MKNFKELRIWQKGFELAAACYRLTATFPQEQRFGLSNQVNRAALSIPCNIAEGSSRRSEKDYGRFIEIALGSCFELETQLMLAKELGLGDQVALLQQIDEVVNEQRMISGFLAKLNGNG